MDQIPSFTPSDWYWQADNGRVFSSAQGAPVPASDEAFGNWKEVGRLPTIWPRDDDGKQTDAALAEVLALYGLGMSSGASVPQSVTRAQAKIALHRTGLLDMVKTAVEADPEVQIWFDDASTWERQNPHVIDLGEQLLGGAAEIDALFIEAAKIAA
ncbi:hypothetical protein [Methylobacterium durans]|uniref:Uncharacterized protein n=1 Tax=Methylobacterium durans TaxID=2202825 RepID=A0A2U8WAL1_9HYPH|nr:hypothetical protein [Methylobacterium durans]AWN43177.1 hypothetical protein DK389_25120 [Methylobacterium durans]